MLALEPAMRALRLWRPDARIELIGMASSQWMQARGIVDEVVTFPGFPGVGAASTDARGVVRWIADQQRHPADMLLQLHGPEASAIMLAELMGARINAGFAPRGPSTGPAMPAWRSGVHEPAQLMRPLQAIGCPEVEPVPRLAPDDAAADMASRLCASVGIGPHEPFVVIHPGATHDRRRWPAARHAAVARQLREEGVRILITGGRHDSRLVRRVARASGPEVAGIAGEARLGVLAEIMRMARLTISSDPGIAMLARSVDARSVTIQLSSDGTRWVDGGDDRSSVVCGPDIDAIPTTDVACEALVQLFRGIDPASLVDGAGRRIPA